MPPCCSTCICNCDHQADPGSKARDNPRPTYRSALALCTARTVLPAQCQSVLSESTPECV